MRVSWRRAGILVVLLAASLVAAAEPSADELERNARLLAKWRTDPDHYARLQRDLRAFYELPSSRQEQLRQLDRDLHDADSPTQHHLWEVLERYSAWLDQLPDNDRQQVEAATDRTERLKVVRKIRERQWIEHLPLSAQLELATLPESKRTTQIARLRQEERLRRQRWQMPVKPRGTLPEVPNRLLRDFALGELSAEERAELKLSLADPESRERLRQMYFKKHPRELQRLRHLEKQQGAPGK